ncbi:MAG TPA: 4Fe-4S dicluster domain-containing protein, partial [Candidatus Ozemobacteraceae bacterium]
AAPAGMAHLRFTIGIAACPNACSRPQIMDVGFIQAEYPAVEAERCIGCGACVRTCREGCLAIAGKHLSFRPDPHDAGSGLAAPEWRSPARPDPHDAGSGLAAPGWRSSARPAACVGCGDCRRACPVNAITPARTGFRALAGGRLGRHPRLATELPGLCTAVQACAHLSACLAAVKAAPPPGVRLAPLLDAGVPALRQRISL